jgi:hypothetical protein
MKKYERNVFNKLILFALTLLLLVPLSAKADEISELKKQLAEQQKTLLQMQQKLEQLEAKQANQNKQIEETVTKVVEEKKEKGDMLPASLDWASKIKLSGDFRYRHESIEAEGDGKADRHRNRIRARLRLDARLNDEWDAIFRFATAETDSTFSDGLAKGGTSTNQTLDKNFKQKNLWLDWAYADYHPKSIEGLNVLMGKMGIPYYRAGKNQLIWDSDLAWEGVGLKYKVTLNDEQELLLNGGGFWLNEIDGVSGADASLWGIQSGLKQTIESGYLLGGASYWHYANSDLAGATSTSKGTSSDFDDDFNLIELFAEYGTEITDGTPLSFHGSYVNNVGTESNKDSAWIIGTKFNKAKKPGSWEIFYDYRDLQADSVASILNDSDFAGGGTAARGHRFGVKYQLFKNVQGALTYFLAERDRSGGNDLDHKMLHADMIFKF